VRHAFTVDVEDWYHGIPVGPAVRAAAEPRLERGLERLLDLLASREVRATFFVLAPLLDRHAPAVRRIAAAGHEIGCHGWSHDFVYDMTPTRFEHETRAARDRLADFVGRPVTAYRAAYFSITLRSWWALEILVALGFRTDSSIFPIANWRYGIAGFDRSPQQLHTPAGPIWELPVSVIDRWRRAMPVSGGAYLRIYPYALTRANFLAVEQEGRPVVFYVHPWELDPDHPRVPFQWKARATHYVNLRSTEPKLHRLLNDFEFGPISDLVGAPA